MKSTSRENELSVIVIYENNSNLTFYVEKKQKWGVWGKYCV